MKLPLWRLRTMRRKIWEALGSERFSIPCCESIHNELLDLFKEPGFFVEAGALDGFFESNTYYLERFRNWKGVLIEPIPDFYRRLKFNRPGTLAYNCALVSNAYAKPTVLINSNHAYSTIVANDGRQDGMHSRIEVPARTLTSILMEVSPKRIDLLSLDVEGYEMEVLRGLDFEMLRPRYLLIESRTRSEKERICSYLAKIYSCPRQISPRDFLYESRYEH